MDQDQSLSLSEQVVTAFNQREPLEIVAGGSKSFYGNPVQGRKLELATHQGIVNYEPTELVITARSGTSLKTLEQTLAKHGQMLGFEPPAFGAGATLGGTIAGNFSGPRRAYAGAARDFVLGCRLINGKGEMLHFGGEVMKNVAGYDVSRLMTGALGTLGVLLEVSLKTVPRPALEQTRVLECSQQQALDRVHGLAQTPIPISASCFYQGRLWLRLSGAEKAVQTGIKDIGGEAVDDPDSFWLNIKEQRHEFFKATNPLWRLSMDSNAAPISLGGDCLWEWGGALRWLYSEAQPQQVRELAERHHGHATLFRTGKPSETERHEPVFHPLSPGLLRIHENLKHAFDPQNILNPGKLYAEL